MNGRLNIDRSAVVMRGTRPLEFPAAAIRVRMTTLAA